MKYYIKTEEENIYIREAIINWKLKIINKDLYPEARIAIKILDYINLSKLDKIFFNDIRIIYDWDLLEDIKKIEREAEGIKN